MTKKGFILSAPLVLIPLLFSCSPYSKHISSWYKHYYNVDELNNQKEKLKSEYFFYNKGGNIIFEKIIGYDSIIKRVSANSGYHEPSLVNFSVTWEKVPLPVETSNQSKNIKQNYPEPQYLNESVPSLYKDESLSFDYYIQDTTNNTSIDIKYMENDGAIYGSEVEIYHDSDTLSYYRTLEVSKDVAEYFRQYAFQCADSIELINYPILPDLNSCKLKHSRYTFTENVTSKSGNRKETTIDSTYADGGYEVQQGEYFYFFYEEKKPSGINIYKKYTSRFYREFHYLPNEVSPCYALEYSIAPNEVDTTFKYEMTTTTGWRLNRYKYVVTRDLSERRDNNDLRLPIVKRELYFWINPRKQSIVRKRYIAFTSQGHRLELDWLRKGYKTKTNINTIPEVSGDLEYDLIPDKPRQPTYPFFNSMSNRKPENSREQHQNETNKIVKHFRNRTLELEKDRESGYEKRITPDSTEIYEFFYLRKK